MLHKCKISDIHRQDSAALPQDLRPEGQITLTQPDIQVQSIVGIAVIHSQPQVLPFLASGVRFAMW
jgi:hypothetical protein